MSPRSSVAGLLVVFILVLLPGPGLADEKPAKNSDGPKSRHPVIQFYQAVISPIDGNRCSMHPSCSGYAGQAIQKHGFFMGWIMACDRLMRCGGDEVRTADSVYNGRRKYTHDPVEANDFWWIRRDDP